MSKYNKKRLNRSDIWRTVLTETLPYEVPIIFSNDGFYKNLSGIEEKTEIFKQFIDALITKDNKYTIPIKYNVIEGVDKQRTLSIIHPQGQYKIAEFYKDYDRLICEYASRSPFSIRKPVNIGSYFYYDSRLVDENKYKNDTVDTIDIDNLVRNPASYFSYEKFNRLYHFFHSDDYLKIEKTYKYELSLDIQKCFDSIYTHSISWAVRNKELAKKNINAKSFGNKFDKIMQCANYNETSGICIGPEVSRIFAEIILAKTDNNTVLKLNECGIKQNREYQCYRYVDNYYIFANAKKTLYTIKDELKESIREYNLHFNESKSEILKRPFYTNKSLVIDKVNTSVENLWRKITKRMKRSNEADLYFPKKIRNHKALFASFIVDIKAACHTSGVGYDEVSNYIIATMRNRVRKLADTCSDVKSHSTASDGIKRDDDKANNDKTNIKYRNVLLLLLDIGFHFFTIHSTASSSVRLSHAIIRVGQHMRENDPEGFDIAKERVLRLTAILAKSPMISDLYKKSSVVPIEIFNILLSLKELGSNGKLEQNILQIMKRGVIDSDYDYFYIVVCLFICADHECFEDIRNAIFEKAKKRILSAQRNLLNNSELVHLLLDLLACTYIESSKRESLLMDVWNNVLNSTSSLSKINKNQAKKLVNEIEQQHWFIKWDGSDMLNMIEKKELTTVYG